MFRPRQLHCSFCGKDETQVSKLVAGPRVYICDACVAAARQIMDHGGAGEDLAPKVSLPRWRRLLARVLQLVSGKSKGARLLFQRERVSAAFCGIIAAIVIIQNLPFSAPQRP